MLPNGLLNDDDEDDDDAADDNDDRRPNVWASAIRGDSSASRKVNELARSKDPTNGSGEKCESELRRLIVTIVVQYSSTSVV